MNMKKKTIKAKISAALSASMAFAMLAPAMPAYAAADKKLVFDFQRDNPSFKDGVVDNWNILGEKGHKFSTVSPLDDAAWQKDSDKVGLPYWDLTATGTATIPGTFDPSKNIGGKPWNDDTTANDTEHTFAGYKLDFWRDSGGNKVKETLTPYFQENPDEYFAKITDTGTEVASYWITRKGENGVYVPVQGSNAQKYLAGAHLNIPAETPTGYKLLNTTIGNDGASGRTLEVYKSQTTTYPDASATEAGGVKLPSDTTAYPGNERFYREDKVALKFDAANSVVTGNAYNRDMVINYVYKIDDSQKFNLNVWDVFFDKDGNEVSRRKRVGVPRNVLDTLHTTKVTKTVTDNSVPPAKVTVTTELIGDKFDSAATDNHTITHPSATTTIETNKEDAVIGFDESMITSPTGSSLPPKYVKRVGASGDASVKYFYKDDTLTYDTPVSVEFSKEKNNVAPSGGSVSEGDFKATNMVDADISLLNSTATPTAEDKSFNVGASDYKLYGKMLNQKVNVYYNYIINPAYYRNVTVQYVDESGININDKAIAAIEDASFAGPSILGSYNISQPTKLYKDNNELTLKVNSTLASNHVEIPIPKLTGYKFSSASDLRIEPTDPVKWSASYSPTTPTITMGAGNAYAKAEIWQTSTASDSVILKVVYARDAAQLVKILPESGIGGDIIVTDTTGATHSYDPSSNVNDQKYAERQSSTTPGMTKVTITTDDLPEAKPSVGYKFDNWVYEDGASGISFTTSDLPKDFEIPTGSGALSMKFKAVFSKDATKYNTYHLDSGDGYTFFNGTKDPEVLNVDQNTGAPRDVHFSDLNDYTAVGLGLSLNPNPFGTAYNIEWYDSSNHLVLKLDSSGTVLDQDTRAIADNETFRVYVVSNAVATAYDPQLDNGTSGSPELLNTITGEPQIVLDPLNPSPMLPGNDYIVTDDNGNVVQVISGTDLINRQGIISNTATSNFLTPGNSYRVYAALSNSGATVGSPIPATNVSANPLNVTIPVAPTPLVTADPAHAGMASIRINPTADNTEYALVDNAGNIVYPFTTPTAADNGTITFDNLDPDTVYHVVPRAAGSNATVPDRMAAGAQLQVDTSNLGLSTDEFKVEVVTDHPLTPIIQQVKIDAQSATEADLDSVRKGKSVEILAPLSDAAGNNFYTWRVISPATGVTVTQGTNGTPTSPASTRIVFTMPTGPVKLQIMYDDGTTWDSDNWTGNNASNHNIGVAVPSTNAPAGSKMRITIKKDQVPANIKQLVADTLLEEYKPEYMFRIVVEKQDASGNWVEYTDPSGDIHLDDVRVNTGVLDFSKNYMLHELATSSNAVSLVRDNIGRINSTTSDPSYVGEFGQNMYAGMTYIFGYSKPVYHKVKVVDNRDNALVANLRIPETNVVNDYATSYSSHIQADTVDNNGITWHYEGLSTDKNNYTAYDPTTRVTDDMTVYIFYSNDKDARRRAENDLSSAIQNANNQLRRITDPAKKAALQAAINAAQAVIDRTNRKSSTPELLAAIDALNAAVKAAGGTVPNNNGGGGGRGGRGGSGGGSGSAGRRASNGQTGGLRVGQDGNWELLNPAEATANPDSSKWVFNLTAGGRVKGWAYLSYTYEGQTKSEWYHFGDDNIMNSGWFLDGNTWYYLSMNHNGFFGEMVKGWHHDGQDGRWYYLDANNGVMHTNWSKIGGEYYFLNPTAPAQTWFYDNTTGRWNFGDVNSRPLGSMYQNENTPDGYHVNESGAWVR